MMQHSFVLQMHDKGPIIIILVATKKLSVCKWMAQWSSGMTLA